MQLIRTLGKIMVTAIVPMLASAASAAGFVNNGATWMQMSPDAKSAYIQGVNDASNFLFINDDLATALVKLARTRCLIEQKTTAAILSDRITTAYTKEPAFANSPPNVVYIAKMAVVCRDFINQERTRIGLPPLQ